MAMALSLFIVSWFCWNVAAQNFRKRVEVSLVDVEDDLIAELTRAFRPGAPQGRVEQLTQELLPMYRTMPKNHEGHVDHAAVRYMLHRHFVRQHGWFIRGLEPSGSTWNASSPTVSTKEWVPSYMQGLLEQIIGDNGMTMKHIAILAASLEDIIHKEAIDRLGFAYDAFGFAKNQSITETQMREVIDAFIMTFLTAGNVTVGSKKEYEYQKLVFQLKEPNWEETQQWLDTLRDKAVKRAPIAQTTSATDTAAQPLFDFQATSRIVEEIGADYGAFNERECLSLKTALTAIEHKKPGRILLSEFYRKALYSFWDFTEKIDYLRVLGALDESNPSKPLVIIPNYISIRTNCLAPSSVFAVCCYNQCEELIGQLEGSIGEPMATPERIAELVANLKTDTVDAPRNISDSLRNHLDEIAKSNAGSVPLHGRLFSQWMHHAFPRECPFPHESGTTSPLTPDEWMELSGHSSTKASKEEMMQIVHKEPAKNNSRNASRTLLAPPKKLDEEEPVDDEEEEEEEDCELPWSTSEELFIIRPAPQVQLDENKPFRSLAIIALFSTTLIPLVLRHRSMFNNGAKSGDLMSLPKYID